MWTRTGTTTNQIAVEFQNPQSTITMLGIMKRRSNWLIRVRISRITDKGAVEEALSTVGFPCLAIQYEPVDKVFVLISDSLPSVVFFINAVRPLMLNFAEIDRAVSEILDVNLSQHYPNPNWIRVSNHSGSTRLKYFSRHQDSIVSEINIHATSREWKIEIKTLSRHRRDLLNHALQIMNFPLSGTRDSHGHWVVSLESTDIPLITNFVRVIKDYSRFFEEIEPEILTLLGIDLTQNYVATHSNTLFFNSPDQRQSDAGFTLEDNAQILENAKFPLEDIPKEYLCSLSLSIMTKPVYLQKDDTGQRFEDSWIRTWLRDNGTHPTTRRPFLLTALREDFELKRTIDEFVKNIADSYTPGSKK